MRKIISLSIVGILLFLAVFFYVRYYFVFGEGVKAGDLNFIVHKGFVFKTWEGRVIQTGIKTYTPGAIQSNEFEFSVSNDSVAKVLELNSGKFVELRYKEYLHALPWRGNSKYVVYEIVNIAERDNP
jgi:hypothetical protein